MSWNVLLSQLYFTIHDKKKHGVILELYNS